MADSDSNLDDVFDLDRIRRLIELMKEHDLSEVDLRQPRDRIRLCRGATADPRPVAPFVAMPPAPLPALPTPAAAPKAEAPAESHIAFIKSPMVGTFYSRPNPKAEPYVRVGDHVDEGQRSASSKR